MAVFHEPEYLVEESVLERNPRTGTIRELDIKISNPRYPEDKTLVECRDHGRKQDVQWIDQLDGKSKSLGFSHVIAVSSSGFTKNALTEATDRKIETMHLKKAEEADWKKWKFGLREFGINIHFDPVVSGVVFAIPPELAARVPTPINLSKAMLLDTVNKKKIMLSTYIGGFQKDPKIRSALFAQSKNGVVNHFDYTIPCDPGKYLVTEPDGAPIPLVGVTLKVDLAVAEYKVPLEHFDVAGERVLVGDLPILGTPTRLVVHETPGNLKVMLEHAVPGKNGQSDFDSGDKKTPRLGA